MAEVIALLASIAGISTAGIQLATLLYSTVQHVKGLQDEIEAVARDVEALSTVFDEISTALQFGEGDARSNTDLKISRRAIVTIADLVGDSQGLYDKIGHAVADQSKIKGKTKWIFRREDVAIWSARITKNISMLTLMMTTLLWAEARRKQVSDSRKAAASVTIAQQPDSSAMRNASQQPAQDLMADLPSRIHKQVGVTVLNTMNLTKLEEAYDEGSFKVQFATGEGLEPRHYVYQPHFGGAMRRENPDRESLWLSERVTLGDADSLAERFSIMTTNASDDVDSNRAAAFEDDQLAQATDLADRLVQDWTNLEKVEETETWQLVSERSDEDMEREKVSTSPPPNPRVEPPDADGLSGTNAIKSFGPKEAWPLTTSAMSPPDPTDLRALYLSLRALRYPSTWHEDDSGPSDLPPAEQFEDEKRRIIRSCFSKLNAEGAIVETYITHVQVIEDKAYPSEPPPPGRSNDNKYARIVIISVRNSGRVRLHKARENPDKTFSVGRTWALDDLYAVRVYENFTPSNSAEATFKTRASAMHGVEVTIGKRYYWQCLSQKERDFFTFSLLKIFKKYTRGSLPTLEGFSEKEMDSIQAFKS